MRAISALAVLLSLSLAAAVPSARNNYRSALSSEDLPPVDSPAITATYFVIRRDLRRCASPMCGGYFVRRINQSRTLCANNRYARECYVSEIDWNGQGEVEPN